MDDNRAYRFRRNVDPSATSLAERDAIAQTNAQHKVPGIVVKRDVVVLRTDSVVVEALLGAQDALDPFAMRMQEAAATEKELQNLREALAQQLSVDSDAYRSVFMPPANGCCEGRGNNG